MNIDVSSILQAVLLALIAAIVPSLVSWLKAQTALLIEKVRLNSPDVTDALVEAAYFAVKAAEQSKLAGLIEDKKDYALDVAEAWLEAKGIDIDLHLIEAAIEKAVGEEFPREKNNPVGLINDPR